MNGVRRCLGFKGPCTQAGRHPGSNWDHPQDSRQENDVLRFAFKKDHPAAFAPCTLPIHPVGWPSVTVAPLA